MWLGTEKSYAEYKKRIETEKMKQNEKKHFRLSLENWKQTEKKSKIILQTFEETRRQNMTGRRSTDRRRIDNNNIERLF